MIRTTTHSLKIMVMLHEQYFVTHRLQALLRSYGRDHPNDLHTISSTPTYFDGSKSSLPVVFLPSKS